MVDKGKNILFCLLWYKPFLPMSDEKFYEALKDIFDKYLNDEDE